MKRLIILGLVFLSACAAPQEIMQPTNTPLPSTPTPAPIETPLPSPTPTPTPEPYLLEDGDLLDWDNLAGEYVVVSKGIDALTTTADGMILALDDSGSPRFVFVEGDWVEVKIPEGVENHEELAVSDRYVTIVNEDGKTEEVLESGIKVLVNPETGIYEYEFKNGAWAKYTPRVMVVGEDMDGKVDSTEIPAEVIETAAETVKNAEMIKRIEDGEVVELKTGLDERWGETQYNDNDYIKWYGILCGVNDYVGETYGFMGVEMNSGDLLLINMIFSKSDHDFSRSAIIFKDSLIPDIPYEGRLDDMGQLGRVVNLKQIASAVLKSPVGTPLYFTSRISGDDYETERIKVWEAMKTGEFLGSGDSSYWMYGNIGASDTFWDLAENQ